jgi:hypothetical protein
MKSEHYNIGYINKNYGELNIMNFFNLFSKKKSKIIECYDRDIRQIVEEQISLLGSRADLNHLDVSKVTNMNSLFNSANFDGDISKWDTSNVTDMFDMFCNATNFNSILLSTSLKILIMTKIPFILFRLGI